jgi:hypothetical protein
MTQFYINLAILTGTNLFWVLVLTWEMKHYKRKSDKDLKWYEKDLF